MLGWLWLKPMTPERVNLHWHFFQSHLWCFVTPLVIDFNAFFTAPSQRWSLISRRRGGTELNK